eukprot:156787_1
MNNSNKYEITIISKDNDTILDEQSLLDLFEELSSSIRRCKVLPNQTKAFITFKNNEAYLKALANPADNLHILPSKIDSATIYKNIQLLKKNMNNRLNDLENKIHDNHIYTLKHITDSINYLYHDLHNNNISTVMNEQNAYQQSYNPPINNHLPEKDNTLSSQETINHNNNNTNQKQQIHPSSELSD